MQYIRYKEIGQEIFCAWGPLVNGARKWVHLTVTRGQEFGGIYYSLRYKPVLEN